MIPVNPDIAIALTRQALDGYDGAAVIDAMETQTEFIAWCGKTGFIYQRPLYPDVVGAVRSDG